MWRGSVIIYRELSKERHANTWSETRELVEVEIKERLEREFDDRLAKQLSEMLVLEAKRREEKEREGQSERTGPCTCSHTYTTVGASTGPEEGLATMDNIFW